MRDEVLHKSKWLTLIKRDGWFEFARHSNQENVAFVITTGELFYTALVRKEKNPAHGDDFIQTVFSGGIEEGESPEQAAIRECQEESGYTLGQITRIMNLGTVRPTKFMDLKTHLFLIFVESLPELPILGDGTRGEKDAHWVKMNTSDAIKVVDDPCFHAIYSKYTMEEV